jgi:hypothetical protein
MKTTGTSSITLCAVLGILNACAATGLAQPTALSTSPVVTQSASPIRASDRMFYWIEESRELHAMATHREREAELVLKNKPGPATTEFVKQMRLLAHRLHEAADYADVQAHEAERDVPPDLIRQFQSALR